MVNSDMLIGKQVIDEAGLSLGEVKGVEITTNTWIVTHLQVKLSTQAAENLGFKKHFRSSTVCMPVSLIKAIGDVITLQRALGELVQNPEITECIQ